MSTTAENERKDRARQLAAKILEDCNNQSLLANLILEIEQYNLLREAVEKGWIGEPFAYGDFLNINGTPIDKSFS